ncbi:DUF4157 domain-containing protein [Paracoccus sp. MBLB3053]|uniref:DUF4157 domain-containing protein n=1 Tax=Paracoccus aurantius TaxID=3073814 RepID=A0ABU2I0R9_9RHOB|nr:DUF4157 domain-containing protein [Paracoccus sp. MBLB3053]MDS9470134.1 DUF4157 domain-containing protein [Paracoccus sp. MBLB3053]
MSQRHVQTAGMKLGRRGDAAERRVQGRLADPAIRAMHDGALDGIAEGAERDQAMAPENLDRMLDEPGETLSPDVRAEMEGAFGEPFGDIRLHRGQAAASVARDIRSAGFAVGRHVGFAAGAWAPESAPGKGLIAHELAHAVEARSGRDDPKVLRGANIFEQFAGLFRSDDFSDAELTRFIGELTRGPGDLSSTVSDNMARAIVARGLHDASTHSAAISGTTLARAAELPVRLKLMRHLLDGYSSDGDQDAVLRILRDASQLEREQLVNSFGVDALIDRFDGARLDELTTLIYGGTSGGARVVGTEQSGAQPQDVKWKLSYNIRKDPNLPEDIAGLALDTFEIRPDGTAEFEQLRQNAMFSEGTRPGGLNIATAAHPKNKDGLARAIFWVVPRDTALWPAYATATRTSLPQVEEEGEGSLGAHYPAIPTADNQEVEARIEVMLAAQERRRVETEHSETRTSSVTERTENERQQREAQIGETTQSGNWSVEERNRRREQLNSAVGATQGAIRGFESQQNWQNQVQTMRENMLRIEGEMGGETEQSTQTEAGIDIHAGIGAEAALRLATQLGIELGTTMDLSALGDVLGPIADLAGLAVPEIPALAGLLSIFPELTGGISLSLSPEGALSLSGDLSGDLRAKRLWGEVRRRNYRLGGAAEQRNATTTTNSVGGQTTVSGQQSAELRAEQGRQVEGEQEVTGRQGGSNSATRRSELEAIQRRLQVLESERGTSVTDRTRTETPEFVPQVREARISFHPLRNGLGGILRPDRPEGGTSRRRRRRGG